MNNLCRSKQAPFEYTLSLIGSKWKMRILYELGCEKTMRYGELKRAMPFITHKMLSAQLRVPCHFEIFGTYSITKTAWRNHTCFRLCQIVAHFTDVR